jgi:hypothetical protein
MTAFMEYIYMQQEKPTNTSGVPIVVSVLDANGNYRTIGTTTSNALGTYAFTWAPDIAGDYTVFANFPGTESYYASEAAAAFYASEPAATSTPAPTPVASMVDQYFLPAVIGIILAIVLVGVFIVIVLRKRP